MNKLDGRRFGIDRRKRKVITLRMLAGNGRRRTIRRKEDQGRIFLVDQYCPILFIAIIAILFLSVLDGLLTLYMLDFGVYEANPIMAYLLDIGPYTFFITKYAITIITTCGLLLLRGIVIQKFNISAQSLIYFVACLYSVVVMWQLYIVSGFVN